MKNYVIINSTMEENKMDQVIKKPKIPKLNPEEIDGQHTRITTKNYVNLSMKDSLKREIRRHK